MTEAAGVFSNRDILRVMISSPPSFDLDFSHIVQQYQPDWLTGVMRFITDFVSPEVVAVVGLAMVIYLHFRKHDDRTIMAMFFMATGYLLIPVLKYLIARPRPESADVFVLIRASDFSMPSGHALGVVLLGGMVALLIGRLAHHHQKLLLGFVSLVIFLVGYSRIYLGVHWLSDVLAGYVLGLVWVILALQIRNQNREGVNA